MPAVEGAPRRRRRRAEDDDRQAAGRGQRGARQRRDHAPDRAAAGRPADRPCCASTPWPPATTSTSVTFALDGKAVLTKKKPPFSVELDLGSLPRTRTLTATAFDATGERLAGDELLINAAGHRFAVRLVEPQRGKKYENSLLAQVETEVPDGETVERVEFFLNETRSRRSTSRPTAADRAAQGAGARLRPGGRLPDRRQLDRGPGVRQRARHRGGERPVRRALHLRARPRRPAGRGARRRRTSRSAKTASGSRSRASTR